MKLSMVKEKYPVMSLELDKSEVKLQTIDEIIDYFQQKIEEHPIATYIATFNHYEHTTSLPEHNIAPEIKNVKNIIFCFGKAIPNTKVTAVRPRSIAVCELDTKWAIEFMEAPNEAMNPLMEGWAKGLKA